MWNRFIFALFSMSFVGPSRGGKRYGAGRRLLSPGSFLKSAENQSKMRKKLGATARQSVHKERDSWNVEESEGIVSVFYRHSVRTAFAVAGNAKKSKLNSRHLLLFVLFSRNDYSKFMCQSNVLSFANMLKDASFQQFQGRKIKSKIERYNKRQRW